MTALHYLFGLLSLIGGIMLGLYTPRFYRNYNNGNVRARLDATGMGWSFGFYRILAMIWIVGMTAGLLIQGCSLLFGLPHAK